MDIAELPDHLRDDAVALWREAGLTRPWNDPVEDLQRALRGPDSTVLAGVVDDRLVGTAMVGHDGHRCWVYYLAVREDHRGRGFGRSLMTACEQWADVYGIPKIQLMVRSGNAPVIAFYERLGYERSDVAVLGRRLDGA